MAIIAYITMEIAKKLKKIIIILLIITHFPDIRNNLLNKFDEYC